MNMKPSPADVLECLCGRGSPELRRWVSAQVGDDQSDVAAWMRGMEGWAKSHVPRVRRRADWEKLAERLLDETDGTPHSTAPKAIKRIPSPSAVFRDYAAVRRGEATADAVKRIEDDLADPDSELRLVIDYLAYHRGELSETDSPRLREALRDPTSRLSRLLSKTTTKPRAQPFATMNEEKRIDRLFGEFSPVERKVYWLLMKGRTRTEIAAILLLPEKVLDEAYDRLREKFATGDEETQAFAAVLSKSARR